MSRNVRCPNCSSHRVRSFKAIYNQQRDATGKLLPVAEWSRPPEEKTDVEGGGCAGGCGSLTFLLALVIVGIISKALDLADSFPAALPESIYESGILYPIVFLSGSFALFIFLPGVIAFMIYRIMIALGHGNDEEKMEASRQANKEEYERALQQWENSWLCRDCDHRFVSY